MIIGPVIAFSGKRFFPYIAAVVISLATFFGSLVAFQLHGKLVETDGIIGSFAASLAFAIVVGCCVRRSFWIMVTIFGGIVGSFLGLIVYSFLTVQFEFTNIPTLASIEVPLTILGAWFAHTRDKRIVIHGTALLGSYMIMRGIAIFYGGFPGLFVDSEEIKCPFLFWMSILIFATLYILSSCW